MKTRVAIVDRKGNTVKFIGGMAYHLQTTWLGMVTVSCEGIPVGAFWRPISASIGLASVEELDDANRQADTHRAKAMGVIL